VGSFKMIKYIKFDSKWHSISLDALQCIIFPKDIKHWHTSMLHVNIESLCGQFPYAVLVYLTKLNLRVHWGKVCSQIYEMIARSCIGLKPGNNRSCRFF